MTWLGRPHESNNCVPFIQHCVVNDGWKKLRVAVIDGNVSRTFTSWPGSKRGRGRIWGSPIPFTQ
jgi:hypothetical protein